MSGWRVVDSVDFARKASTLRGEVALASLQRLCDALFDPAGQVTYLLEGFVSDEGKPSLRLQLSGPLVLVCQRCLAALPFDASTQRMFVLTSPGDDTVDLVDEDEDVEHLPADSRLDVLALVEDELLLSLPIAPVHELCNCEARSTGATGNAKLLPFGALAALKRNKL